MQIKFAALCALAIATAGCKPAATPTAAAATPAALSDAAAARIADDTVAVWSSMDAAKIKATYAPDVVAFDYGVGGLTKDRADFDKRQDVFAAAKLDKFVQKERKIQILDADTFIMSGTWDGTSSTIPANNGSIRCTDVFRKSADGAWLVVNEHCSSVPAARA